LWASRGKRRAAAQVKTGEPVPIYLALRENGDEFWSKLRPKSLAEVTRYLEKLWQPLHGEPVDKITRQMVRSTRRTPKRPQERANASREGSVMTGPLPMKAEP
jgi:hypothetical protein